MNTVVLDKAPYGKRFLAWLIDNLIVGAISGLTLGLGLLLTSTDTIRPLGVALLVVSPFATLGFFIWNFVLRQGNTGQTIGKSQMGIQLVSSIHGVPVEAGSAFFRCFVSWILRGCTGGLFTLVDLLFPLFDKNGQRLVDKMLKMQVTPYFVPEPIDMGNRVLIVDDLTVEFNLGKDKVVKAVSGVSFEVFRGETLAIVGESGCGKSTLGKAILQLPKPTSGSVKFLSKDLTRLKADELRDMRPAMQMIFQDPISSLDPRLPVSEVLAEPLRVWNKGNQVEIDAKIDELLNAVNLDPAVVRDRRSYEFSGGQCQRISIARSLALDPTLIICDEPVSALDVSVQAQILNLLQDMKDRYGLTLIFISHDLAVVKTISTRVMVMYLGKVCEVASPDELYKNTKHHYTKALVGSVPIPDPTVKRSGNLILGEPPSPMNPPSGCRFRTRCPMASEQCANEEPQLREVAPGHFVACHHPA